MKMAAKRFLNESEQEPESNPDQQAEKRKRTGLFPSVLEEVAMIKSLKHLCTALEPVLRKVVNEEVDKALRHCSRSMTKSSSLRIQALEPSSLQLVFPVSLSLPIFTSSKVLDVDRHPLRLRIVNKSTGHVVPASLLQSIRVEIVVLDGDFAEAEKENWSSQEFEAKIVKERIGKRPLIHGDVNIVMRDGEAAIGDIEFTDNSSWIRSRRFRIGARVSPGSSYQGIRIREAVTEAFTVKDHRGELYKKHHPPALGDEVWRLEKIGKDGKFHRKLSHERINTVQDFLKLSTVDPLRLRKILGNGMSDKMWEVTLKHARTCEMGTKMYIYRGHDATLFLDPICQLVRGMINGQVCSSNGTFHIPKPYVDSLLRQAYDIWDGLEEVDGVANETNLITQGDMIEECGNFGSVDVTRMQRRENYFDGHIDMNNDMGEVYESNESIPSSYTWGNNSIWQ